MCIICVEWQKGNMTAEEAFGAIREISASTSNKQHLVELASRIMEKESPMDDRDEALEKQWWNETYSDKEE